MKKCIFLFGMFLCSGALALDMPKLAQQKNCSSCHAIDKATVGPAWRDVAKRYKGNMEAPVFLVNKIQQGGFGVWGLTAMPGQNVTNEEAGILVRFILGLPAREAPVALGDQERSGQGSGR